jgi:hypothetical protein
LPDVAIVVTDVAPVMADLTPGLGGVGLLCVELRRSGGQRERDKESDTASHGVFLVRGRE